MRQQFALTARTLNRRHAFAISRHVSPELCVSLHPLDREGAGKAGRQPAPAVCRAKCTREKDRTAAYRCGRTLGLPCAMVGRRMPCSPGSRNSFWPPSSRGSHRTPRRLARRPHPPGLDRSIDGQDHTVLPYARFASLASGLVASCTMPPCHRQDEPDSAVRPRAATGSLGTTLPAHASRARRCCVHRKPGSRSRRPHDRPSGLSRDGRYIRHFRISVKWNFSAGRG